MAHYLLNTDLFGEPLLEGVDLERLTGFMKAFYEATYPHPFDRSRVWDDAIICELKPFDGKIHMSWLQALNPREGKATAFMKWLCGLADQHQVAMSLSADPRGDYAMPKKKLVTFYKKFGFANVRGDFMVREPKAEQVTEAAKTQEGLQKVLEKKFQEFKAKFTKAVYLNAFRAIKSDAVGEDYDELIPVPIVPKKLPARVGGKFTGKEILINSSDGLEDQIDTLLHEMVHLAVYQWLGNEADPHGPFFEAIHRKVIGPMPKSWKAEE